MSGAMLNWAARVKVRSASEKAVLLILAEAADGDGRTFIGQATIAERAALTRRAVIDVMQRLEGAGLIERVRRNGPGGHRSSDLVQLRLDEAVSRGDSDQSEPSAPRNPRLGEVDDVSKVNQLHSNPYYNPQLDSSSSKPTFKSSAPRMKSGKDAAFEAFLQAYPHFKGRSSKRAALLQWGKLSGQDQQVIAEAAAAFAASRGFDRKFSPAAERWIRDEKWRDFLPAAARIVATDEPSINWQHRAREWSANHWWPDEWGPRPGKPGCMCPSELLRAA